MNKLGLTIFAAMLSATAASAQTMSTGNPKLLTALPGESMTVTDWYKQNVYDRADNKIGQVMDVLVGPDGRVTALIVGVGGFLGLGEKDVAVPFDAITHTLRDNKTYLTMDTNKDALKAAPGFSYDRSATRWMPVSGTAASGTVRR